MIFSAGNDEILPYFGLSVYEDWLTNRWKQVPDTQKQEIIQMLFDHLLSNYRVRFNEAENLKVIDESATKLTFCLQFSKGTPTSH